MFKANLGKILRVMIWSISLWTSADVHLSAFLSNHVDMDEPESSGALESGSGCYEESDVAENCR